MIALTDAELWSLDQQCNEITTPYARGIKLQKVKSQSLSLVHEVNQGRVKCLVRKRHMERSSMQLSPFFPKSLTAGKLPIVRNFGEI